MISINENEVNFLKSNSILFQPSKVSVNLKPYMHPLCDNIFLQSSLPFLPFWLCIDLFIFLLEFAFKGSYFEPNIFCTTKERQHLCDRNKYDIHNIKKTIFCLVRNQMIYTKIGSQHLFNRNKNYIYNYRKNYFTVLFYFIVLMLNIKTIHMYYKFAFWDHFEFLKLENKLLNVRIYCHQ